MQCTNVIFCSRSIHILEAENAVAIKPSKKEGLVFIGIMPIAIRWSEPVED